MRKYQEYPLVAKSENFLTKKKKKSIHLLPRLKSASLVGKE